MKLSWLQFLFYALSLGISLVLNIYQPEMLDLLCTPLPVKRGLNVGSDPILNQTPSNSPSLDREK